MKTKNFLYSVLFFLLFPVHTYAAGNEVDCVDGRTNEPISSSIIIGDFIKCRIKHTNNSGRVNYNTPRKFQYKNEGESWLWSNKRRSGWVSLYPGKIGTFSIKVTFYGELTQREILVKEKAPDSIDISGVPEVLELKNETQIKFLATAIYRNKEEDITTKIDYAVDAGIFNEIVSSDGNTINIGKLEGLDFSLKLTFTYGENVIEKEIDVLGVSQGYSGNDDSIINILRSGDAKYLRGSNSECKFFVKIESPSQKILIDTKKPSDIIFSYGRYRYGILENKEAGYYLFSVPCTAEEVYVVDLNESKSNKVSYSSSTPFQLKEGISSTIQNPSHVRSSGGIKFTAHTPGIAVMDSDVNYSNPLIIPASSFTNTSTLKATETVYWSHDRLRTTTDFVFAPFCYINNHPQDYKKDPYQVGTQCAKEINLTNKVDIKDNVNMDDFYDEDHHIFTLSEKSDIRLLLQQGRAYCSIFTYTHIRKQRSFSIRHAQSNECDALYRLDAGKYILVVSPYNTDNDHHDSDYRVEISRSKGEFYDSEYWQSVVTSRIHSRYEVGVYAPQDSVEVNEGEGGFHEVATVPDEDVNIVLASGDTSSGSGVTGSYTPNCEENSGSGSGSYDDPYIPKRCSNTCNKGRSCDGHLPQFTHCVFDAETSSQYNFKENDFVKVELLYSPYCQTKWVKTTPKKNKSGENFAAIIKLYSKADGKYYSFGKENGEDSFMAVDTDGSVYSRMLFADKDSRCLSKGFGYDKTTSESLSNWISIYEKGCPSCIGEECSNETPTYNQPPDDEFEYELVKIQALAMCRNATRTTGVSGSEVGRDPCYAFRVDDNNQIDYLSIAQSAAIGGRDLTVGTWKTIYNDSVNLGSYVFSTPGTTFTALLYLLQGEESPLDKAASDHLKFIDASHDLLILEYKSPTEEYGEYIVLAAESAFAIRAGVSIVQNGDVIVDTIKSLFTKNKNTPNQIGKAGEDAVKLEYDIGDKEKILINGRWRIPDGINETTLSEIKNVRSLSYTQQLRDFADIAKKQGLRYDLYVRPSTELSGPLIEAIADGTINLKYIPGTK